MSLTFIGHSLSNRAADGSFPTIAIETPIFSAQCGPEPIDLTLDTSGFEVFRAFGGRRTTAEVRALPWVSIDGAQPERALSYFDGSPFAPPEVSLGE